MVNETCDFNSSILNVSSTLSYLSGNKRYVFTYSPGKVWMPLFPYSPDLLFSTQEEAKEARFIYDECDPNLVEVLNAYPYIRPVE